MPIVYLLIESCPGLYRCRNSSICLDPNKLCDYIPHCPYHDDELLCDIEYPEECQSHGLSGVCRNINSTSLVKLPKELRTLTLSENDFSHYLPSFEHLINLVILNLSNCMMKSLESYSFVNQKNLLELDLRNNRITNINPYAFIGLDSLKTLNLEGNNFLAKISDLAFLGLHKIPSIVVTNSRLQNINKDTLKGLVWVSHLNLSKNDIRFVSDFAFQNLTELTVLDLRKNKIEQFSSKIFFGLSKLTKLYTDFVCILLFKASVSQRMFAPSQRIFFM